MPQNATVPQNSTKCHSSTECHSATECRKMPQCHKIPQSSAQNATVLENGTSHDCVCHSPLSLSHYVTIWETSALHTNTQTSCILWTSLIISINYIIFLFSWINMKKKICLPVNRMPQCQRMPQCHKMPQSHSTECHRMPQNHRMSQYHRMPQNMAFRCRSVVFNRLVKDVHAKTDRKYVLVLSKVIILIILALQHWSYFNSAD